jgi:hypothetical protein
MRAHSIPFLLCLLFEPTDFFLKILSLKNVRKKLRYSQYFGLYRIISLPLLKFDDKSGYYWSVRALYLKITRGSNGVDNKDVKTIQIFQNILQQNRIAVAEFFCPGAQR